MIIIRDAAEMASLAGVWNELAELLKIPLLHYEWFAACVDAYCEPGHLRVVVKDSPAGIDAIAPLVSVRRHGSMGLQLLGTCQLSEPSGLIYRDRESLRAAIIGIVEMQQPVILERLAANSPEVLELREIDHAVSFTILKNSPGSPFLPVTTSWNEFESNLPSRRRYDLRRAQKRSQELGGAEVEIISPTLGMLDHYLEEIFRVESAGWKGRAGTAILYAKKLKRFLEIYSRAACSLGILRLGFLRVGSKPAAAMLAVECYERFWVLKVGYDEAFSRCSPGILLMHEAIRYSFEKGLEAFEFLGHDAPWIHFWTEQQHPCVTACIYPSSLSGKFRLGIDQTFSLGGKALGIIRK